MIKAIFFDLDGVLVDACDWHFHSLNDSLRHFKGIEISYDEHLSKFNGLPTSVKLQMLNLDDEEQKKIWQMKQDRTLENIRKFGQKDKYKIKMLDSLKKEGYILVCVTNSIRETAIEMLKVTGQLRFFDKLITNEDVDKNKPHPDCYLLAMSLFSLNKEQCIIIEDSAKGRQAAYASGANVLEVEDVYDVTLDNLRRML